MPDSIPEKVEHRDTSAYTYRVEMIVQVLAGAKDEADEKLEKEGGFVTHREVFFVDKTPIYSGNSENTESEDDD